MEFKKKKQQFKNLKSNVDNKLKFSIFNNIPITNLHKKYKIILYFAIPT